MRAALLLFACTLAAQAQWQILDAHATADLRGIDNVGKGVVWASGSHGTVLRSEDGGLMWQGCTVPPGAEKLDFRGIQAFDANTAIVMSSGKGDLSRLYKTTDGCQTWKLLLMNPDKDGFWDAIKFEGKTLWLLGDPVEGRFTVIHFNLLASFPNSAMNIPCNTDPNSDELSRDCADGMTADPRTAGAYAASNSALFIGNPRQAYFGPPPPPGERVPPMTTINIQYFVTGGSSGADICERMGFRGGDFIRPLSWTCQPVPVGTHAEGAGAFSLAFGPQHRGVIVGGDYMHPNNHENTAAWLDEESTPTGKWTAAKTPPHGYRSSVAYDAATKTWITVGPNGTDISTDDGRNWRALKPGPGDAPDAEQRWNALSLPFVVGPKGRIGVLRRDALSANGAAISQPRAKP